jgi:hypothetical protein
MAAGAQMMKLRAALLSTTSSQRTVHSACIRNAGFSVFRSQEQVAACPTEVIGPTINVFRAQFAGGNTRTSWSIIEFAVGTERFDVA